MATYYEILGVPEDASIDQINAAYVFKFSRVIRTKPHIEDKFDKRFYLATEACAVLTDPEKRGEYDKALREGKAPEPGAVLKTGDTEQILRASMGKTFDKMFDENTLKLFREQVAKKESGELREEWARQNRRIWFATSVVSVVCLLVFSLVGLKLGRIKGFFIGFALGGFLSWFLGRKIGNTVSRKYATPFEKGFQDKLNDLLK